MRSDLSATLELLRSGESVKVTQRGKPDLILERGQNVDAHAQNDIETNHLTLSTHLAQLISSNLSTEVKEEIVRRTKMMDELLLSDRARQSMIKAANAAQTLQGLSESFMKALERTQTRHADIIKKLEDK